MSLSANSGYYSYQWLRNDTTIAGATAQTYLVKRTGVYKVQVKGSSNAPTHTTATGVTMSGPTSQALNLVSTTQLFKEGQNLSSVIDTLSRDKLSQVISYMDGMGRSFQTLAVAASPDQYTSGPRDQPPTRKMSTVTARLQRALNNHFEGLILFTLAVVVVTLGNQASPFTAACAWTYLGARGLYIPAYALGLSPLRSAIWGVGFLATVAMIIACLLP